MRVYIFQVPILDVFPLNTLPEGVTKASLVSADATQTLHRDRNERGGIEDRASSSPVREWWTGLVRKGPKQSFSRVTSNICM